MYHKWPLFVYIGLIFPYKKKKYKKEIQKREIFLETMWKKNYRLTELSYELSIVIFNDLIIELAKHIEFFCVHAFVLIITIIIFKLLHSP